MKEEYCSSNSAGLKTCPNVASIMPCVLPTSEFIHENNGEAISRHNKGFW